MCDLDMIFHYFDALLIAGFIVGVAFGAIGMLLYRPE